MNRDRVVSILAASGRRLGPDAVVLDVGESLKLPHAVLEVEAVVEDGGLLAVLYRQRLDGEFDVSVHVHRGRAFGGCVWGFRGPDADVLVHVTLDPEAGAEALRLRASEMRLGRTPHTCNTGTAELDLPWVPWEGRVLASTAVGDTQIEVDQCAFGGLGGRARLHTRGRKGGVAAILDDGFREIWLPSPGASALLESAEQSAVPPHGVSPRLHAFWGSDLSVLARPFPPRAESGGIGVAARAHGWVTDADLPALTDVVAFHHPTAGHVQLLCTPVVWERVRPVLFSLSPNDGGRVRRVRTDDGLEVEVAVFAEAEPGHLEWAARGEGALPLRLGLLERRMEAERAQYGEWRAMPYQPDTDGWQRMRSRLVGPEGRAEIAFVARGARGPSFTLGTCPRSDQG